MKLVDQIPRNPKVIFICNSQEACEVPLRQMVSPSGEPPPTASDAGGDGRAGAPSGEAQPSDATGGVSVQGAADGAAPTATTAPPPVREPDFIPTPAADSAPAKSPSRNPLPVPVTSAAGEVATQQSTAVEDAPAPGGLKEPLHPRGLQTERSSCTESSSQNKACCPSRSITHTANNKVHSVVCNFGSEQARRPSTAGIEAMDKKAEEEILRRKSDAVRQLKRKRTAFEDRGSTPSGNSPKMGRSKKARKIPCRRNAANAGDAEEPIMLSSTSPPTCKVVRRPRTRNKFKPTKAQKGLETKEPPVDHRHGGNKKGAEDDGYFVDEKPKKLNVRCNPGDVFHSIWIMNDCQRQMIHDQGFGKLLEMTVDGIESRALLRWLLDRTSPVDMKIHAGPGRTLPITKEIISQVMGIPRVGGKLPIIEYSDQVAATRNLREDLGLAKGDHLSIFTLQGILVDGRTDDISMRSFFMILLNRLLLPSSSWDISGNEIALSRHWRSFRNIDWAQILYNDLCVAVEKWHERDMEKPTWTVYGCSIFFICLLLDNFDHKHAPQDSFMIPRVKFYNKALIDELTRADKKKRRDGSETFGHCPFKSWSSTCYAHFHVADENPHAAEIPVDRPVADRTSATAIHMPRMTELIAGRIARLKGHHRKLAQEVWLEFDREVEVYVSTMNNCHDRIVQMQLRTAQRFQDILDDSEHGGR
ncbi:hypothetical protein ACP4OV_014073 [Aristida adscensionis]